MPFFCKMEKGNGGKKIHQVVFRKEHMGKFSLEINVLKTIPVVGYLQVMFPLQAQDQCLNTALYYCLLTPKGKVSFMNNFLYFNCMNNKMRWGSGKSDKRKPKSFLPYTTQPNNSKVHFYSSLYMKHIWLNI